MSNKILACLSNIDKEQNHSLMAISKVRNGTLALNPNVKSYALAKQAISLIHKYHIQITVDVKNSIIKLSKQNNNTFNNKTMLDVISMNYVNYMVSEYSFYQNKYRNELSHAKQVMASDK